MSLASEILAVLAHASEAMNAADIGERCDSLDDASTTDARRAVGAAITSLIDAGQIERIWSEGRCTYVVCPDAPAFTEVKRGPAFSAPPVATAQSVAAAPATAPQVVAPSTAPDARAIPEPTPRADAPAAAVDVPVAASPAGKIAMATQRHEIQQQILDALTKAGEPMSGQALAEQLPGVAPANLGYHRKQLIASHEITKTGNNSGARYALPGMRAPKKAAAKARVAKLEPATGGPTPEAPRPQRTSPAGELSLIDLRAAAAEILLGHGGDPLPIALHRLVVAAAAKPLAATV